MHEFKTYPLPFFLEILLTCINALLLSIHMTLSQSLWKSLNISIRSSKTKSLSDMIQLRWNRSPVLSCSGSSSLNR